MNKILDLISYLQEANRRRRQNRPLSTNRGLLGKEGARIGKELGQALGKVSGIPVLVVSYNNFKYVNQITDQLNKKGIIPIVIDNASPDTNSIKNIKHSAAEGNLIPIFSSYNFQHMVGFIEPVYEQLPNTFAYTDPDLRFMDNLPDDFLCQLAQLTEEFDVYKAACALPLTFEHYRLSDKRNHVILRNPFRWEAEHTIREWENKFWKLRIQHDLEIYAAPTDTTFAVYNKSKYRGFFVDSVRVAGPFSAIHLPWFEELDPMTDQDRAAYMHNNRASSWK